MIMNKESFYENLEMHEAKYFGRDIYVVFGCGYTIEEARKAPLQLELLEFEFESGQYVWLNDWDEGHKYINLFAVLSDDLVLKIIIEKGAEVIERLSR